MTKLAALMSVGVAILAGFTLTAQPAAGRTSTGPCAAVGETSNGGCEGFWNIYASFQQGDLWWFGDKNGESPTANRIDKQAETVRAELRQCGITSYVALSDWFDTFRRDLVVVHSNAHSRRADAEAELAIGRACGISGYTKFSPYQVAGRD